jgi:hypothetical protein
MSRIEHAAVVAAAVGISLTGCSALSMSSDSSSEQLQALNFESDPPGAEIRTGQLQTCTTPCALMVPSQDQAVAVSKNGYVPQTVQVTTGPQPEHSFWQHPPPTLVPNPVHVVLRAVPKPVRHAKGHKLSSVPAPSGNSDLSPPPPPTQGPAAHPAPSEASDLSPPPLPSSRFSAFPPPPPKQ